MDCGNDAHTHVADCAFNTANRNVFPPGAHNATLASQVAYYETVQSLRKAREVEKYLSALAAPMREKVLKALDNDQKGNCDEKVK